MDTKSSKSVKYPGTDSTDPAVLEQLGLGKKPSFGDQVAALTGTKTPAQLKADAEHQLDLMAKQYTPGQPTQLIAVRLLKESPTNPRKRKGNIDELIASIRKTKGPLQAPIVRKIEDGDDYEIVVGHQRVRASKEVGLDEIFVDVRQLSDNDVLEIQATEQIQRTDLHELEEAEHYGRMVKAEYTPETIADRIGRSKGYVVGRIKLLSLCPEARSAFYDGTFHPSVAIPLARIYPSDIQAKALSAMLKVSDKARVQIEFLQKEFAHSLKGAPFNPKDELLVEAAGSCIACPYNAINMDPTLFGDVEKGLDRHGLCLNTPCYGVKCNAQAKLTLAKAKDSGAEVLSATEARSVLQPNGALQYKADYVKADDIVHADPKKRSWEQILEKLEPEDRPKLAVTADPANPGKTIKLFDRKEAMKGARELGLKWAQPVGGASKSPEEKAESKAARAKEREASVKQDAVLKVTQLTIPRLAKHWSKKAALPEMRIIAAEAFANRKTFSEEDQETALSGFDIPGAKNGKVPTEAAVEKWIEKEATLAELIGLTLVLMRYEKWIDTDDNFNTEFSDLAAAAGANLKEGLRAQQLEASLAAEKKGAKK